MIDFLTVFTWFLVFATIVAGSLLIAVIQVFGNVTYGLLLADCIFIAIVLLPFLNRDNEEVNE